MLNTILLYTEVQTNLALEEKARTKKAKNHR